MGAVPAARAQELAQAEVGAALAQGLKATIMPPRLILSFHAAPDYGPVWMVKVKIGGDPRPVTLEVREVLVDGISGEVLEMTP